MKSAYLYQTTGKRLITRALYITSWTANREYKMSPTFF